MEIMTLDEIPWNDYHHRSYFLPDPDKIENDFSTMFSPEMVDSPESPISVFQDKYKRNWGNISTPTTIDISVKIGIIENIHIVALC